MICPRSGLFCGCCALRREQESEADFHGLISFQLGNVSSKQECCHGVSALEPHGGGDRACPWKEALRPAVPPPARQQDTLPFPKGHHAAICWLFTWTPTSGPAVQTTPRLRAPSAYLSWPEILMTFQSF